MSLTALGRILGIRRPAMATSSPRSIVVSALETLALVLNEDSPVPESDRDVDDLMLRLRGHLMQLGPATPDSPAMLKAAQALASKEAPDDYLQARVHLRKLALAIQELITEMSSAGAVCEHQPECPSADAEDRQAARVRVGHPEAGWSVLCNGVLTFDDTGCLTPDNVIVAPQRPLPTRPPIPAAAAARPR
ncbi:DUF5999 family protein [[Kitasatospora] papulosa]|uniref:DUF5999 family protein n=1 Tax=[Kitasatospora] papulosa TaxID=1464011 RepID=UPI0036253C24